MKTETALAPTAEILTLTLIPIGLFSDPYRVKFFIPVLWIAGLIAFYFWRRDRKPLGDLWGWKAINRQELKALSYRFLLVAVGVIAVTVMFFPESLWSLYQFARKASPFMAGMDSAESAGLHCSS